EEVRLPFPPGEKDSFCPYVLFSESVGERGALLSLHGSASRTLRVPLQCRSPGACASSSRVKCRPSSDLSQLYSGQPSGPSSLPSTLARASLLGDAISPEYLKKAQSRHNDPPSRECLKGTWRGLAEGGLAATGRVSPSLGTSRAHPSQPEQASRGGRRAHPGAPVLPRASRPARPVHLARPCSRATLSLLPLALVNISIPSLSSAFCTSPHSIICLALVELSGLHSSPARLGALLHSP
ncbi:hypothetical protein NDU88_004237, partial [Pleurodeles waltl]